MDNIVGNVYNKYNSDNPLDAVFDAGFSKQHYRTL